MFLFISTIEQIEVCNIIVILLGFSCMYSTSLPIYGRLAHIYTLFLKSNIDHFLFWHATLLKESDCYIYACIVELWLGTNIEPWSLILCSFFYPRTVRRHRLSAASTSISKSWLSWMRIFLVGTRGFSRVLNLLTRNKEGEDEFVFGNVKTVRCSFFHSIIKDCPSISLFQA